MALTTPFALENYEVSSGNLHGPGEDHEPGFARGPERALISALLFDGVQNYMNYTVIAKGAKKNRYKEAFQWVNSRSTEYIFSFENCCQALGIDPDTLRFGLQAACEPSRKTWKRGRRKF